MVQVESLASYEGNGEYDTSSSSYSVRFTCTKYSKLVILKEKHMKLDIAEKSVDIVQAKAKHILIDRGKAR